MRHHVPGLPAALEATEPDHRQRIRDIFHLLCLSATPRKVNLGCLPNHHEGPQDRTPVVDPDADCTPAIMKRPAMWEVFCSSLQSTDQTIEMTLIRKFHSPQQVLEARVGAQRVEPGRCLQVHHPHIAVLVGPFQPLQRFIFFSQASVNDCKGQR